MGCQCCIYIFNILIIFIHLTAVLGHFFFTFYVITTFLLYFLVYFVEILYVFEVVNSFNIYSFILFVWIFTTYSTLIMSHEFWYTLYSLTFSKDYFPFIFISPLTPVFLENKLYFLL